MENERFLVQYTPEEGLEQASQEESAVSPGATTGPDRLIEPQTLRYITKALELLRPEANPLGEERHWKELCKEVKPWETGLELSDNVRETVRSFVEQKIPKLKEAAPTIGNLDDQALLDALTHNWFEGIEKVSGQRRGVLLTVMAHVVKRIETTAYRKIFQEAAPADLEKLGLDEGTRDLLVNVLEAAIKADPLFVRFLAYSQLSPEPPSEASGVALYTPESTELNTIASLFPHETQFLSRRLLKAAEENANWISKPGGELFKQYLEILSLLYGEKNISKAAGHQEKAEELYSQLLATDFPIVLSPPGAYYYKEPYIDPEMRVSIATPDSKQYEAAFNKTQSAMADSLDRLGVEGFSEQVRSVEIRSVIALSSFGVNLASNEPAEVDKGITLFLNEQIRKYDQGFPEFAGYIANTGEVFKALTEDQKRLLLENISRTDTILHELSHLIYPEKSQEAERIGVEPNLIIDEAKADIVHRGLTHALVEKGGLDGTKEQWAVGMLASSLQSLKRFSPDDPYFQAAVYAVNNLFERGVVSIENDKIKINDFDAYFETQREATRNLLAVYDNPETDETKAADWIKKYCQPNNPVQEAIKLVKGDTE